MASVSTPCFLLLGVVAPCLKVVKPLSQQLPTFLLFHARALHMVSFEFTKSYGLYSSHNELLHPFPPHHLGGRPYERGGDACLAFFRVKISDFGLT